MHNNDDSEDTEEGTNGRTLERSEKVGGLLYKYNREDFTYTDMINMNRQEGDLFAVFHSETGTVGVLYSTANDFANVAFDQVKKSSNATRGFEASDIYYIIGSLMISRIHKFDFYGFMHLLDHELNQVFDMRMLIEWTSTNRNLFLSPAEEAVMRDAENAADLQHEYNEQEKGS